MDDENADALVENIKLTNVVELEDAPKAVEETKAPQAPSPTKLKKKKIGEDYDKKSQVLRKAIAEQNAEPIDRAEAKRREEEADHELTEELFTQPIRVTELNTEEEYQNYSGEVAQRLAKGKSHYRIPLFFKDLLKDTATLLTSTQLSELLRIVTVAQSEKVKQEKGPVGKKKTKTKAVLKGIDKRGALIDNEDEEEEYLDEYSDFV